MHGCLNLYGCVVDRHTIESFCGGLGMKIESVLREERASTRNRTASALRQEAVHWWCALSILLMVTHCTQLI